MMDIALRPQGRNRASLLAKTTYTLMLSFLQVQVIPLRFYERPTLLLVSTNWKKSEEDFLFKKKKKGENSIQYLICNKPF